MVETSSERDRGRVLERPNQVPYSGAALQQPRQQLSEFVCSVVIPFGRDLIARDPPEPWSESDPIPACRPLAALPFRSPCRTAQPNTYGNAFAASEPPCLGARRSRPAANPSKPSPAPSKIPGRSALTAGACCAACSADTCSHFTGVVPCPRPTSTHRLRQLPSDSHLRAHSVVDSLPCRSARASCRPPRY
jgi:hypothetical protein